MPKILKLKYAIQLKVIIRNTSPETDIFHELVVDLELTGIFAG